MNNKRRKRKRRKQIKVKKKGIFELRVDK